MALCSLSPIKAQLSGLKPADDTALISLSEVASAAFESITQRHYPATDYDILFDGADDCLWHTPEYPIISISRLQANRVVALTVEYTAGNASASLVDVVPGEKLTLSKTVNAVTTPNEFEFAEYGTVSELATAIDAVAGWNASAVGNYGTWPTTELLPPLWKAAPGSTSLDVFGQDVPYRFKAELGEIYSPWGFRRGGFQMYRLRARLGYECVPQDVAECVAELTCLLFRQRKINPNLASESLDTYSYSTVAAKAVTQLSYQSQQTIENYKRRDVVPWRL